jgi:hypothetical protein
MSANLFSNVKRFCCPAWTSSRTSPGPCNDDLSGASPQACIHELNESPAHGTSYFIRVKFLVDKVCTSGCLFSFNIAVLTVLFYHLW